MPNQQEDERHEHDEPEDEKEEKVEREDEESLRSAKEKKKKRHRKDKKQKETMKFLSIGQSVKNFKVHCKLGQGGFGVVYKVKDKNTGKFYAMKCEALKTKWKGGTMAMEITVLQALEEANCQHVCRCIDADIYGDRFIYMVMTLIGPSLMDLRKSSPGHIFTLSTILRMSMQCLSGIRSLHRVGYLHRDLKPQNFSIGLKDEDKQRIVYLLDFGMCRRYVDDTGRPKMPRKSTSFKGTVRYAPKCCHDNEDSSMASDLESWFYQTVEFTVGTLPWASHSVIEKVGKAKGKIRVPGPHRDVFFGDSPIEYQIIFSYICSLDFFEEPHYHRINTLMKTCLTRLGGSEEDEYDWEKDDFKTLGKTKGGEATRLHYVGLSNLSGNPGVAEIIRQRAKKQRAKSDRAKNTKTKTVKTVRTVKKSRISARNSAS